MRSSLVVAESLRGVDSAMAIELPELKYSDQSRVLEELVNHQSVQMATGQPPKFLRPHQVTSWRRSLAAIHRWNGALIAEPVGFGKTWVALAIAANLGGDSTIIAPPALRGQWFAAASGVGINFEFISLEKFSRGKLPPAPEGLVIIDEAHRFRNTNTVRYTKLSDWIADVPVLLLTATPMINRRNDLLNLLALILPEDALRLDGVPSLGALAGSRDLPGAARRVVVRTCDTALQIPLTHRVLRVSGENSRCAGVVQLIGSLTLDHSAPIGSLIATVLLDAGASSDAALRSALRRYALLLKQSADSGGASRQLLRLFAGRELDQTVMWQLVTIPSNTKQLPVEDLDRIETALDQPPQDDGWISSLKELLADNRCTIAFCRHRATARLLRTELGDNVAWVTGSEAGVGTHRMSRELVLSAFGPERGRWSALIRRPTTLIATEVLAEGLNLQAASRVVHVDMPWHHVGLEQRIGRIARPGQLASTVEEVFRLPGRAIEQALRRNQLIEHKQSASQRWLCSIAEPVGCWHDGKPQIWLAAHPDRFPLISVLLVAGAKLGQMLFKGTLTGVEFSNRTLPRDVSLVGLGSENTCQAKLLARNAVWEALRLCRTGSALQPLMISRVLGLAHQQALLRNKSGMKQLDRLLMVASQASRCGTKNFLRNLAQQPDSALLGAKLPDILPFPQIRVASVVVLLPEH